MNFSTGFRIVVSEVSLNQHANGNTELNEGRFKKRKSILLFYHKFQLFGRIIYEVEKRKWMKIRLPDG